MDIKTLEPTVKRLSFEDLKSYIYLYHGTYSKASCDLHEVEKIDLTRGKKEVDFGRGFYLTNNASQAIRRAKSACTDKNINNGVSVTNSMSDALKRALGNRYIKKTIELTNDNIPFLVKYKFKSEPLKDIQNKKIFEEPNEDWLKFIFNNRKKVPDEKQIHNKNFNFSFVYGYMADGEFKKILNYFYKDFGELTIEQICSIYSVFVAKKDRMEIQISIHTKEVLTLCLNDGESSKVEVS